MIAVTTLVLAALQVHSGHVSQAPTQLGTAEEVRELATAAVEHIEDTADARREGFVPFFHEDGTSDRTPFQGEHWMMPAEAGRSVRLDRPLFIMFARVNGDLKRVGSAYIVDLPAFRDPPEELAGVPAKWHTHQSCREVPGEGHALAHDSQDCVDRGGRPARYQTGMVHVWTDEASPQGPFAHDNPALPFLAVGLEAPSPAAFMDDSEGPLLRKLAIALAESYDSRMEYARRIERRTRDAELQEKAAGLRARIAELIGELRRAEQSGDEGAYGQAAQAAVEQGEILRRLYAEAAPSDALRIQLEVQYEMSITGAHDGVGSHHHE